MRLEFFFRWFDLWIGVYIDRKGRALYLCPIPMFGVKVSWGHTLGAAMDRHEARRRAADRARFPYGPCCLSGRCDGPRCPCACHPSAGGSP